MEPGSGVLGAAVSEGVNLPNFFTYGPGEGWGFLLVGGVKMKT
jgi:hypothetical protein